MSEKKNKCLSIIVFIILVVLCELFFFRNIIFNDSLIGSRGDGRLTTLLVEHWWRFLQGKEKFTEIRMFFPAKEVMGYTDMLLGYGVIYCIFRVFSIDMYTAYKITLIIVHFIGVISMYLLLNKRLRVSTVWSMFGTIAFMYSNTLATHMFHTQMLAISVLPCLLILLIGFFENVNINRKKKNIYAYSFISLFALLTYNSWYVAFFTGYFCLFFIVIFGIKLFIHKLDVFGRLISFIKEIGVDIIGYVVYLILVFIPFVLIYVPSLKISQGFWYEGVTYHMPELIDLINVDTSNWMLGDWIAKLELWNRGGDHSRELTQGYSVIFFSVFLMSFSICKRLRDRETYAKSVVEDSRYHMIVLDSVYIAIFICILSILRLSSNGVSLWSVVFKVIPMATSVRAIARLLLWLSFPMAIVTSYIMDTVNKKYSSKLLSVLSCAVVLLLFISNIDRVGVSSQWNAGYEKAFVDGISAPPEEAEMFFIVDSGKADEAGDVYQLDAMEIAYKYDINTINGYSGNFPAGWDGIYDPCSDVYMESIDRWIDDRHLENVYSYDMATDQWIQYR